MATQTAVMEQGVNGRAAMDRIRDRLYSRLRAETSVPIQGLLSSPQPPEERQLNWPDGSRSSERSRAAI